MAGAGYKLFNTGDVLTAAQVNTYLMEQTVMVFADAAARTTALSGVLSEGMISYLKDTNAVEVYNGSAWVASDDPNAIQNTIVDAKGDLITATAADTPARLAVGANDLFLTADSTQSTGLKWSGTWTSFTPTWTNLTVGNGTGVYKYLQIGKLLFAKYKFTFGSTSSMGTNPNVTLPINPASGAGGFLSYSLSMTDVGVGSFNGSAAEDTNKLYLASGQTGGTYLTGGTITATAPFTWVTGDFFTFDVHYEVA